MKTSDLKPMSDDQLSEQLGQLKREAFKDGVKHAQGFMAMPNAQ